jgi:hypothetical protein
MKKRTSGNTEEKVPVSMEEMQRRLDAFDRITVTHDRMEDIEKQTLRLISQTKAVIASNEARIGAAKGRQVKPDELWVLPIIGPSGSTKSKSIQKVVDNILTDPNLPDDDVPILMVTVRNSSRSPRLLQAQILEAYKDASAETVRRSRGDYSEAAVNEDIRRIARARRTSVIVLDEAHSMLVHGGEGVARIMATSVKSLVNDAVFSVVILGTDDVYPLFKISPELRSRCKETVNLGKLKIGIREDRDYFFKFAGFLEQEMRKKKVIDESVGLIDSVENRALVYDMADGVIGIISRVCRLALERALNADRRAITWKDIEASFQGWNAAQEEQGYDPFGSDGVRDKTLAACREDEEETV